MHKYITEIFNYLEYKLVTGLLAVIFTDDVFKLILIFCVLEVVDILTRWIAQSYKCYKDIYPQNPCGITTAIRFAWQARKWRYIRSTGLREGCDKMLIYLLLLLVGALVDAAYTVVSFPRVLSTVIITVLASTEALSILENVSECNDVVKTIKARFKEKCGM